MGQTMTWRWWHKMTHIYITRRPRFGQVCVFPSNPLGGPQFQRAALCVIALQVHGVETCWNRAYRETVKFVLRITKLSISIFNQLVATLQRLKRRQYMAILEISWSPRAASNWESKWPVQSFTSMLCALRCGSSRFNMLRLSSIRFERCMMLYVYDCLCMFNLFDALCRFVISLSSQVTWETLPTRRTAEHCPKVAKCQDMSRHVKTCEPLTAQCLNLSEPFKWGCQIDEKL
jgi:hypothetical protein